MKKILVTGAYGFIGSHLVEQLIKEGHEITVLDNFSTGKRDNLSSVESSVKLIEDDLSSFDNIEELLSKLGPQDHIYHLAGLARIGRSIDNPIETHQTNVNGILKALELARRLKVKSFLYASSSSVYGDQEKLPLTEDMKPNPRNPYATQKLIGELYCDIYQQTFGLNCLAFRLFNVYGPRMDFEGGYKLVFPIWIDLIKKGSPLTIYGDGEQTRDFTYISDIVNGLILGLNLETNNFEVINLGSGMQTSVNKLAELFDHPTVHMEARLHEERAKFAGIDKAKDKLGWEPRVTIEVGIEQLKDYYLKDI